MQGGDRAANSHKTNYSYNSPLKLDAMQCYVLFALLWHLWLKTSFADASLSNFAILPLVHPPFTVYPATTLTPSEMYFI